MRKKPANLIVAYPGSKATQAEWHVSLMPKTEWYVSVFGGTASEFLFRPQTGVEIYNDIDSDLHNAWAVIRDRQHFRRLVQLIRATPNGRRQFRECMAAMDDPDPVVRAWSFIVCGCTGVIRRGVRDRNWQIANRNRLYGLLPTLPWWRDRMRYVRLECRAWQVLVEKYDTKSALLYLDPPYLPESVGGDGRHNIMYRHTMTREDHIDLLLRVKKCKAKVMLCGYGSVLYDTLLTGWTRLEKKVRCRVGSHQPRTEVLWLNYKP